MAATFSPMMLVSSIFSVAANLGYPALVLLVMVESAGVPIPGETALVTAGVLAASGRLSIVPVILLAAAAAIVGDNLGYVIGHTGGRYLLQRPGPLRTQRAEVLRRGEPFFARHGAKAVFLGRFITGLRTWTAWLAGATEMSWRAFALWNALGGVIWATVIGLLAYYLGHSVESVLSHIGLYALPAAALAVMSAFLIHRHRKPVAPEAG